MSGPGWLCSFWISSKSRRMSDSEAMSTWWEERHCEEDVFWRSVMRSSTAVLFVEYVRARWQPWEESSRAQAAPRLEKDRQFGRAGQRCEVVLGRRRGTYPPDAPVIRARRPLISLSTVFGADIFRLLRGPVYAACSRRDEVPTLLLPHLSRNAT